MLSDKKLFSRLVKIIILLIIVLLIILSTAVFTSIVPRTVVPVLTLQTPQKAKLNSDEEIIIDMTISSLGEALYPAASFSISFDKAHLEFLGVKEGNVLISGNNLPNWSFNAKAANESGLINIMYLDITGGKYSFKNSLLAEEDNVVLRLAFRLRGSARANDVYRLTFEDAVFAASDSKKSHAKVQHTLTTIDGKIVVGE